VFISTKVHGQSLLVFLAGSLALWLTGYDVLSASIYFRANK